LLRSFATAWAGRAAWAEYSARIHPNSLLKAARTRSTHHNTIAAADVEEACSQGSQTIGVEEVAGSLKKFSNSSKGHPLTDFEVIAGHTAGVADDYNLAEAGCITITAEVETRKTGGTDRLISSHSSILAPLSTPTERAHSIALSFSFPFV
jgi:hypothetical protein